MKKRISVFCMMFLAAVCSVWAAPKGKSEKVLCYNVRNCVGMDGVQSCERVAEIIRNADVEVVALQELDSLTTRYPGKYILGELAELTGMFPVFGPSIDYRGGKYGIGILTRNRPLSWKRVPLPCRSEPRSLLMVELEDYYFCCTHLSLHEEDRIASAAILSDVFSKLDKPAVLCGDFNDYPESRFMNIMAEYFQIFRKTSGSRLTFPADEPDSEIDYICLYAGRGDVADVESHSVIDADCESDHRPIRAEFSLRKGSPIIKKAKKAFRIVSYNIGVINKFVNDDFTKEDNVRLLGDILREAEADAVCLQELDSCNNRNPYYQIEALAKAVGGKWKYKYSSAIEYRGGTYGSGVMAAKGGAECFSIPVPTKEGTEDRVVAVMEYDDYVIASTHLNYAQNEQVELITAEMMKLYGDSDKPVFLGGDMNAVRDSRMMDEFRKNWSVLSETSYRTVQDRYVCIDYILQLKNKAAVVDVLDSQVIYRALAGNPKIASDHYAIYVDIPSL